MARNNRVVITTRVIRRGRIFDKVGTTGAAFLKIPCGARAIGMGEAFTISI